MFFATSWLFVAKEIGKGRRTMMQFLIRRFVKNAENYQDQKVRAAYGTLGSLTGMILNLLLAGMKILLGILTGSVAVTADGVNNLSDAGGSLVALLSVQLAQKPYDDDHPFGHGRIEYLGALAVGCLIAVFGVELLGTGVKSILNPAELVISPLSMVLMVLGALVKLWMWHFYTYIGKKTDNPTMIAAGQDSLSDSIATGAVVLSMGVILFLGWPVDGYVGVAVALLVLKAAWEVLRDTVNRLLGGKPDQEMGERILNMLKKYPEILGVHDFVLHDYGPGRCMASIHAEVSAQSDIVEIHEVIDRAEREIASEMHLPICIHMDPIVVGDADTEKVKGQMEKILSEMDPPLKMHDFRRVPGEKQINLIFDVLLPVQIKDIKAVEAKIAEAARGLDMRYQCVIHFDLDYFSHDA